VNRRAAPVVAELMALAPMWVLVGLAGCGGGEAEGRPDAAVTMHAGPTATAAVAVQSMAVTRVQLEGCVVDRHFIPAEGRVEALQADGRAVAHGDADAHGIFRLRVPPDVTLRIRLAGRADSDPLEVLVLHHDLSVAACLMDEARG